MSLYDFPDGRVISADDIRGNDLPPAGLRRWTAQSKAAVVRGLAAGLLTRADALAAYEMCSEELDEWIAAYSAHGQRGLRASHRPAKHTES